MFKLSKKISYTSFQNVLLWLLITAGPIKPLFIFLEIPIDWTFFVFALVVIDIAFNTFLRKKSIRINKEKLIMIGLLAVLYAIIVLSLTYTQSANFAFEKALFFSINVLFFIYPLFIVRLDLKLFHKLFLYIFLPIAFWFIVSKALYFTPYNSGNRLIGIKFYEIRRNYLGFGMGLGILFILQIHLKKSFYLCGLTLICLFGLAARGALIFLLLTVLIWKWKSILSRINRIKLKRKMLRALGVVAFLLPIVLITQYEKIMGFLSVGLLRFQSLIEINTDKSMLGRFDRLTFALETIFSSISTFFFGEGIGSFGVLYTGVDVREYPHNIFLEAWFELGIFFLILLVIFLIFPFMLNRKSFLKALIVYCLFNALKSGDLIGLWLLFFFIGLLVFNPKIKDEITS